MKYLITIFISLITCAAGFAQPADMVIVNARITTQNDAAPAAEAMAVRDGRILAIGRAQDVEPHAGPATRRIDAQGRRLIPGLIDSHIHAVRAGLTFSTEVNWIGAKSIPEAMNRLREAAAQRPEGWLVIAGGWTELQFAERRRPTLQEVLAAVPDRPVYIQMLYSHLLVTPKGWAELGLNADALPAGLTLERGQDGQGSGWITGSITTISPVFDRLPKTSAADNLSGMRSFFAEMNRLGVTGLMDTGGFNLFSPQYEPLFELWRSKQLTVRVAYSLFAQRPGTEFADYQAQTAMMPMGFGDDMLRFNGIGERITVAMYNNNNPDAAVREKFLEILRWAAKKRMTVTNHWGEGSSAHLLLDMYEQVHRETPITGLRWSIAHLDNAPAEIFPRMKALGIGWTMQDLTYLAGDRMAAAQSREAMQRIPPMMTALRAGVVVGAGSDAHRVSSYNPFVGLQWMLVGRTVGGQPTRGPQETPTREEALRMYTLGSAWFSFDDDKRGSLQPGKLADFAILDRDIFAVPVEQIGGTVSLLTVVGGRVVYAAAPFKVD
jgi:predicted amidohydrolase YtcJ